MKTNYGLLRHYKLCKLTHTSDPQFKLLDKIVNEYLGGVKVKKHKHDNLLIKVINDKKQIVLKYIIASKQATINNTVIGDLICSTISRYNDNDEYYMYSDFVCDYVCEKLNLING